MVWGRTFGRFYTSVCLYFLGITCYSISDFNTALTFGMPLAMERNFKQWWSTIPPISTRRKLASHINSLSTKCLLNIIDFPVDEEEYTILSFTSSIWASKLHWLYNCLLYTVTDRNIVFVVPLPHMLYLDFILRHHTHFMTLY